MRYWLIKTEPGFRLFDWLGDFHWLSDDGLVDDWPVDVDVENPGPGDVVFLWHVGSPEKTGIIAQGKILPAPELWPLARRKSAYFAEKAGSKEPAGQSKVAVKYERITPGNPLAIREMEAQNCPPSILPAIESRQKMIPLAEDAGKKLRWLMVGRTTFIDLTYCET
jgi:hypothetical protein